LMAVNPFLIPPHFVPTLSPLFLNG
jgi:hypothetical protein